MIDLLVNLFGDKFADVFVFIIIIVAIGSYIYFNKNKKIKSIVLGLKEFNMRVEELKETDKIYDRINKIYSDKMFGEEAENLYSILEDYIKYIKETDHIPKAEIFFTLNNTINEPSYRSLSNIVPGALTSLGVLGTFLGLQEGTSRLNNLEPEVIEQTIQGLMQDMSLAFITSIFGILTSLFWLIFDRRNYNNNIKIYNKFIDNMNKYTVESSTESILLKLLKGNKEIESATKSMATDLSLEIGKSFEKIVDIKLLPGLENSISQGFGNSVSGMSDEIQKNTNKKITEEINKVGDFVVDLKDEVEDLKENEFKELRLTLDKFNEDSNELLDSFVNINENAKEISLYYENLNKSSQTIVDKNFKVVDSLLEASGSMKDNIALIDTMTQKLVDLSISNNITIEKMEETNKGIIEIEESFNKKLGLFTNEMELLTSELSKTSESINNSLRDNVVDVEQILKDNSFEFGEDLGNSLRKTFSVFDDNLSVIYKSLNGTISDLDQVIKELPLSVTTIYNEMNEHVVKLGEILEITNKLYEDPEKIKKDFDK